jgi:hypothetical protein
MPRTREIIYEGRTLFEFLSENMFHSEFEKPETSDLGWKKTSLTRACNSPETLSLEKIKQLSVFIFGTEKKTGFFIEQFGCGKQTITIDEAEKFAAA